MCDCFFPDTIVRTRQHASLDLKAYGRWLNMIRRCYNPKDKDHKYYGARGIRVCSRWLSSFAHYLEDVGRKPDAKTLDRSENDLGYCPHNTKWQDANHQNINRRAPKKKSTLPKGIVFNRSNGYYLAQIRIDRTLYSIACSKDATVAIRAYEIFHREWFGH